LECREEGGDQRPEVVDRHVLVANPRDADREALELACAELFTQALVGVVMHAAVDLDREAQRGTIEVDAQSVDHLLASKLQPMHLSTAEGLPRARLTVGRVTAGKASGFALLREHDRGGRDTGRKHRFLFKLPISRQGEGDGG
jgi:hypothetical protein